MTSGPDPTRLLGTLPERRVGPSPLARARTESVGQCATFGSRIRQLRLQRGWSQHELARRAGCDPAHINRIEAGRSLPSLPMAVHLAETLREPPLRLVALMVAAYQRPIAPQLDVWDWLSLACQERCRSASPPRRLAEEAHIQSH